MPLSGEEMLRLYLKAGWGIVHRKGSPVKVGRNGLRETIPLHRELARGLERKPLRRLERGEEP